MLEKLTMNKKNKELLEKLNKNIKKRFIVYGWSVGAGMGNKIKRLISAPEFYIPHLFFKFFGFPSKLFKSKTYVAKLFWGKEIILKISDPDSFFFYNGASLSELNLIKFFIKNFKEDDIFYDIGANHGFYTYLALELCKEVHSFEPLDYIVENIQKNTPKEIKSKKLFLNNVALSNKSGIYDFYFYRNHSGSSSLIINSDNEDKAIIKVKCITLEKYLAHHNPPTMIKMDVEGAEKMVIEGGLDFFKNSSPIVTIEVWSKNANGEISMEAVNLLRRLGYQSYYIDIEGDIHKIEGDLSQFVKERKKSLDNFVFKK